MDRRAAVLLIALIALIGCRASPRQQPLYGAGTDRDDGHGLLASASSRLMTAAEEARVTARTVPRDEDDDDEGDPDDAVVAGTGGNSYGGAGYGGATYATYSPPPWTYPSVNRAPPHTQQIGLTASIEGTIRWRGAVPKLTTACGVIEPISIGEARAVAGVVVYLERVQVGRTLPHTTGDLRPATVGGTVVRRGCALVPVLQVVTPVPAAITIHGGATATRVVITPPNGAPRDTEVQEGGRVALQAKLGVTRIESDDGTLGAAWVLAVNTPAYALTDDRGRFRLEELAPGTYEVTIWQPPIPTMVDGKLSYPPPTKQRRSISVRAGKAARLDVTLGR